LSLVSLSLILLLSIHWVYNCLLSMFVFCTPIPYTFIKYFSFNSSIIHYLLFSLHSLNSLFSISYCFLLHNKKVLYFFRNKWMLLSFEFYLNHLVLVLYEEMVIGFTQLRLLNYSLYISFYTSISVSIIFPFGIGGPF
jgi:hypothetical protein